MKLPKKLKVGGRNIKVIFPYKFKEKDFYGLFSEIAGTIQVADKAFQGNKICNDVIQGSFWHETIHAIGAVYNNDSLSEDSTNNLSEGLYQVLKDNFVVKVKGD